MNIRKCHLRVLTLAASLTMLGLTVSASAFQSDNDFGRSELGRLDRFFDSHPNIAQALETNPALATNNNFLAEHPTWKSFLEDHPDIRADLKTNASGFMQAEDRFDVAESRSDTPRPAMIAQVKSFDAFLDQHPVIANQLAANPSLITNKDYVTDHPELESFLKDHSAIRDSLQDNPQLFMKGIAAVDVSDAKPMSGELKSFDAFLDQHPVITNQLAANPSLITNKDYVTDHPELESFLKDHPAIRESLQDNPQAFMNGIAAVDASDTKGTMPPTKKGTMPPTGDNDSANVRQITTLDKFMDSNTALAKELDANPALIRNQDFLNKNPDLVAFLKDHPDLAEDWRANPSLTMTDLRRIDNLQQAEASDRSVDVRTAVQNFDNFLDNHAAITAELEHHPALATSDAYLDQNPQLKTFLQDHPGVVSELKSNPQAFMSLISRYDNQETPRDEVAREKTTVAAVRK